MIVTFEEMTELRNYLNQFANGKEYHLLTKLVEDVDELLKGLNRRRTFIFINCLSFFSPPTRN